MGILRTATVLGAIGLSLASCTPISWTRVTINHPLRPADVAFVKPGKSTWNDVMSRLGAPNDLVPTASGVVANYYYYDGKHFGIDFGYPLNFVGPLSYAPHSMILRNLGVGTNQFQVAFDTNGIVQYDSFSHAASAAKFKLWPF